ncbi:MAG: ribbon-helix-helix domain-containing protein [Candidatus Sigynarchaeota archaeon]
MTTIPVKIDEVDLRKIDHLVKIGRFKNRSQAIRSFIRDKLGDAALFPEPVDPEIEKRYHEVMVKLKELARSPVRIESTKTALELVKEERERI